MNINLHTHTPRCRHAVGTEREYIEAAIANGYTVLGFSDHAPMPFRRGYISGCRMLPAELEDYITTLTALREEYADRIRILIGFEAEYYPEIFNDFLEMIRPWPVDYLILGQHYLNNEEGEESVTRPTDDIGRLHAYVTQVSEGLRTGVFTYLAHPDMLRFTGPEEAWREEMLPLCILAKELSVPLEINLHGMETKRHYPSERMFRLAKEVGNEIVVGLDTHDPASISDRGLIREAEEFAHLCGVDPLTMPALRDPKR